MVYVRVPHIKWARSRDGRTKHFYHRVTGEKLGTDPVKARTKAMHINARLAEEVEKKEAGIGSISDLVTMYKASNLYTSLAISTQQSYVTHLDFLVEKFGCDPVKDIDREFVLELKDQLVATPRKADMRAAVLSRICAFAIDRPKRFGLLINPASRTGRMAKSKAFQPWPKPLIETFRKGENEDLWRVVYFILNTGQRVSDAIKARWSDISGGRLRVIQKKTGAELSIPFTPEFGAFLETYPVRGEFILAPAYSDRWRRDTLTHNILDSVRAYGFDGYSMHGLRSNAADNLAEAGCSIHEIASITGHQTLAMVQKYTARRDQRRLATSAVNKLIGPQKTEK